MIDNEDELEIKIEYFDSFETDPLGNDDQEIKSNDTCLPNNRIELINQEESSPIRENDVDNCENNAHIAPEIVNWHKQVDEFGKYVCGFCDLSYSTTQTLRHHVRVKHTQTYNKIKSIPITYRRQYKSKCHICKKTFQNNNELHEHSCIHDLNNTQNSCLLCLATFKDHNEFLSHMTNKHQSLKKLHICATCGYSTSKMSNYKKHMNIHTKENMKKCSYCPYTTNIGPNMKIHEQIHRKEKPYVCGFEGCEYRSKTVSALRSHRLMHNKDKNTLYCDKCSYSTVYRISFKKHIETHWRKKLSEQNIYKELELTVP